MELRDFGILMLEIDWFLGFFVHSFCIFVSQLLLQRAEIGVSPSL